MFVESEGFVDTKRMFKDNIILTPSPLDPSMLSPRLLPICPHQPKTRHPAGTCRVKTPIHPHPQRTSESPLRTAITIETRPPLPRTSKTMTTAGKNKVRKVSGNRNRKRRRPRATSASHVPRTRSAVGGHCGLVFASAGLTDGDEVRTGRQPAGLTARHLWTGFWRESV